MVILMARLEAIGVTVEIGIEAIHLIHGRSDISLIAAVCYKISLDMATRSDHERA